jgi:hypothetical protein
MRPTGSSYSARSAIFSLLPKGLTKFRTFGIRPLPKARTIFSCQSRQKEWREPRRRRQQPRGSTREKQSGGTQLPRFVIEWRAEIGNPPPSRLNLKGRSENSSRLPPDDGQGGARELKKPRLEGRGRGL